MIEIVKYSNRKYYFAGLKNYISLVDLKVLIQSNHSIRVTDYKTKSDITKETLKTILYKYTFVDNEAIINLIKGDI